MTNYEKIKGYSIEEMANFINSIMDYDTTPCEFEMCRITVKPCGRKCWQGVKEWLESEAEADA